jgi:ketosteroid isomerase-like protein
MKKIMAVIFLFAACNTQQTDLRNKAAEEIIQADKDMNSLAAKEGFNKALLFYADDSVVKFQDHEFPVIGKAALKNYWSGQQDTKNISWEPFKAEASISGDLGYTLGNWKFITPDTVIYGNYYTIWKKQADGKWSFVIDGGNNTPAPE